jgi:hypothetical protein
MPENNQEETVSRQEVLDNIMKASLDSPAIHAVVDSILYKYRGLLLCCGAKRVLNDYFEELCNEIIKELLKTNKEFHDIILNGELLRPIQFIIRDGKKEVKLNGK